ncbi:MAG: hypothetical protein ABII27_01855 [bacterium]
MDNIILIAAGVIILTFVGALWLIVKIRQADTDIVEDDSEPLIPLAPPAKKSSFEDSFTPSVKEPTQQLKTTIEDGIANIETKLNTLEISLQNLTQSINTIQSQTQQKDNNQISQELNKFLDLMSAKVDLMTKTINESGIGSQNSQNIPALIEIKNILTAIAGKIGNLDSKLEQNAGIGAQGGEVTPDTITQKVDDLSKNIEGMRDGGEEILSKIIAKLDLLNKVITTYITQEETR